MAVASRGRAELVKQWKERDASPERRKVWAEPKPKASEKKAAVVYYLARNGHLEHPHFMEVSLSSTCGLYLRDVIARLNELRGKGMASMYSWSSKRSYKNGFVWHDLSEDDFIHPILGHEYVLKGTELLRLGSGSCSQESVTSEIAPSVPRSAWTPLDLRATDASTQTDEKRHRRRGVAAKEEEVENSATELGRDEISPPPSSPSPEAIEALIKSDGRIAALGGGDQDRTVGGCSSGRVKASTVLMQLISCGSISVKDHGLSVVAQHRARLPRGSAAAALGSNDVMDKSGDCPSFRGKVVLEEKEYFSGSLIEIKRTDGDGVAEFPILKRSSSYDADRGSKMELPKEIGDLHARCMPRKPRNKKEGYLPNLPQHSWKQKV
ncbi:protein SOSEKI 5-like [Typha angustifolia]|uniref:protein SOSEKI 5-like n=1 Tax=Typha angustifolia TaxID=59011 RepID=UPI003C2ADA0C